MNKLQNNDKESGKSCCGPTCCGGQEKAQTTDMVVVAVQEKYGAAAVSGLSNNHAGVKAVAQAFGYSDEELSSIPADANLGLSCGNPTATASLRPGEVVVDLGSGGGIDVLLAAKKVGLSGKAIGIDMTPAMIQRARKNAVEAKLDNVEFHHAMIDKLPLAANSVDCIISNCVINLAPDKNAVFGEMFRVLKPGGRVAVSDIALKQELPAELGNDLMAYVGCIAGAIGIDDYRQGLAAAGFDHVVVIDSGADLNVYGQVEGQSACCSPASKGESGLPIASCDCSPVPKSDVHSGLSELLTKYNVNEYAASVKVYAVKPKR
jgi:SAM-dependent methyltransferase